MNEILSSIVSSVKQTLTIYIRSGLTVEHLKKFIELLEQGKYVDILIEDENSFSLRQDPLLYHHCGKFNDKGGAITRVRCNEPVNAFFLVDYKSACFVSPSSATRKYDEVQHKEYLIKTRRYVESLRYQGASYQQDGNDITIQMEVNSDYIKMGESVQLKWLVKGASDVTIDKIGPVATQGKQDVTLYENTILKVIARTGRQVQVRTLYVRTYGDVEINYDLGFLNPITQQYSSLVNAENHSDVFGLMKGHSVQLNWEVSEAERTTVRPFGLNTKKGSHTFTPEKSFDIEIEAIGNGQTVLRTIHIRLFPVPVFRDKFTKVNTSWLKRDLKVTFPTLSARVQSKEIQEILYKTGKQYVALKSEILQKSELYSEDMNVRILRDKMLARMHKKYILKQEIMQYVEKLMKDLRELRNKTIGESKKTNQQK